MSLFDTLTIEQRTVIHRLLRGDNVFLTGGGGVGKSYLLSTIYTHYPALKKQLDPSGKAVRIRMTALTGCAALLLGNHTKTLHSWAGIGLGKGTIPELHLKIRRNARAMTHWMTTDILVIDEISMMTAELLDKLNQLGKKIRHNPAPFGGIQVLLVGDFYQLPPVTKGQEETLFAFESHAWQELALTVVELTVIQRQKDEAFQRVLREARIGALSFDSCALIQTRMGHDWQANKIRPTLLFPRRADVEAVNRANLSALTGPSHRYQAKLIYDGKIPKGFKEKDDDFQRAVLRSDSEGAYAVELELLLGAQVMLIANIDAERGLVNGSRGAVVGFVPPLDHPIVEFMNGVRCPIGYHSWPIEDFEFAARSQVPLQLAWAYTIHKCQGSTLDSGLVDIGSGVFEYGQAYVALSRLRSLEAMYVYDFSVAAFRAHPKVKAFYQSLVPAAGDDTPLPAVCMMDSTDEKTVQVSAIAAASATVANTFTVHKEDGGDEKRESVLSSTNVLSSASVSLNSLSSTNVLEPGLPSEWLFDSIPTEWKPILDPLRPTLAALTATLDAEPDGFLPDRSRIWRALELTPPSAVRVVFLGKEPYSDPEQADGLAFSVPMPPPAQFGFIDAPPAIPPAVKNLYKELAANVPGWTAPSHGCLEAWAPRGVLLLNSVVTVPILTTSKKGGSGDSPHGKKGWDKVVHQILHSLGPDVVYVLFGQNAIRRRSSIAAGAVVHEVSHPSPLSAHKGFLGSQLFSMINRDLEGKGQLPMDWTL